ncbi:hypothetical protein HYFRA_00003084 [Hymenoscyphus fraxineus]|uniref:Uncharacterized protein n=1 Tax=Hymenoscyphus fraxineus TaxID=746836 RepID=A0A9N9KRT2_9HELO|nr:hypothetical protein HYFRA_00003084 [Hymenoscyphus fraxineus]
MNAQRRDNQIKKIVVEKEKLQQYREFLNPEINIKNMDDDDPGKAVYQHLNDHLDLLRQHKVARFDNKYSLKGKSLYEWK